MTPPPDLADKDALISLLMGRLEALSALVETQAARIVELEAKLGLPPKGPDNSSVPPSRGQKASGSGKAKAKKKPHAGAHRALHPNPTRQFDVTAQVCRRCGADVSDVAQAAVETYERIEIPKIEPDVTRIVLRGGVCPCCTKTFKAPPPEGLEPGSPFGPELRAYVIYLRSVQGLPLARLSGALKDLFGLDISEGALVNILDAAKAPFAAQTSRLKTDLMRGAVIASDETGLRVGKKNTWLWVFHHDLTALFLAHQTRARAAVEEVLGDWRPDYWISDRYGGQMNWATKGHQYCLAHLIRDARYQMEAGDTIIAPAFLGLLKRACAIGRQRDDLSDAKLAFYQAKLVRRLSLILTRTPDTDAGRKMIKIIQKTRRHLFVFITNRALSATNNGSERALRPCAVYRKITNGFRSAWAATLYANVRSAVETARRRNVRAIDAIRLTLSGEPIPKPT
jgi:transposase